MSDNNLNFLNDALRPLSSFEKPTDEDNQELIRKALKILEMSPEGQKLYNLLKENNISTKIIYTAQDLSYLPNPTEIYISLTPANHKNESKLVLLLAGALKDAEQELSGKTLAGAGESIEVHMEIALEKQADKLGSLCVISYELDELKLFPDYSFLDEMKKMGHNETVDIFLENL